MTIMHFFMLMDFYLLTIMAAYTFMFGKRICSWASEALIFYWWAYLGAHVVFIMIYAGSFLEDITTVME